MLYWIGVIFTLLAAYLVFRIKVRQDYLNRGSLSFLSTTLEFVIFAMHANVIYLYLSVPWPQLPPAPKNPVQLYIGAIVSILGLVATLVIMAHLGFKTTVGQQPDEVRQTGPYRWTRNPQILSYGVLLLGFGIMYPSLQTATWVLLFAAIGHMMVLTEEEHLKNQFGEKYQEYCSLVPRYLGKAKGILFE